MAQMHMRLAKFGVVSLASSAIATSAFAQTAFEATTRGATCRQDVGGSRYCSYKVGKDLEFSIAAVGEPDAGVSFLRSNIKGDFYARFGVQHGCIIVAAGESAPKAATVPGGDFICLTEERQGVSDLAGMFSKVSRQSGRGLKRLQPLNHGASCV